MPGDDIRYSTMLLGILEEVTITPVGVGAVVRAADTGLRIYRTDCFDGLVPILEEFRANAVVLAVVVRQVVVVRVADVRFVERNPDDVILKVRVLGVELGDHFLELRHIVAVHAAIAIGHIWEVLVGFLHVHLDFAAAVALPLVGGVQHIAIGVLHAVWGFADQHAVGIERQAVERGVAGNAIIGQAIQEACRTVGNLAIGVVGVLGAAGLVEMHGHCGILDRQRGRSAGSRCQCGHCGRR